MKSSNKNIPLNFQRKSLVELNKNDMSSIKGGSSLIDWLNRQIEKGLETLRENQNINNNNQQ